MMHTNKIKLILLTLFFTMVLSACTGQAASTSWPGMLVEGEKVYLSDGAYVYIVNSTNGQEQTRNINGETLPLRFPEKANSKINFYAVPAITPDGQIIVGSAGNSHNLYSIATETLSQSWIFEDAKDVYLGGALVLGERIFAPNGDGNLYVFDFKGNLVDTFDAPEHGLWSTPVTDGKYIYLSSLDHNIYAIAPDSLKVIWSVELDGAVSSSPTLTEDGRIYVGTLSKTLYALDSSDGKILWSRGLDGWLYSSPALDGDTLYVGAVVGEAGGKVYAIASADGTPRWEFTADGAVAGTPLALTDAVIFTTETGTVYSVDKQGVLKWDETFEHNFYAGPVLAGDIILVAPSQSPTLLLGLDQTGVTKWKFQPEN